MSNCSCGGAGCKLCTGQAPPKIFIPIEPMGAVRMTRGGKHHKGHANRNERYFEYKEAIGIMATHRLRGVIEPGKAVVVTDLTFYMPIPKNGKVSRINPHTGKRVQVNIAEGMPHIATPDIDNLIKGLFDSLNKVAWADDNQVYRITNTQKVYSDYPGIEFGIEVVE